MTDRKTAVQSAAQQTADEMTLADLLLFVWRAKYYVFFGAMVGLVLAVLYIGVTVPQYKATMLIAPADRKGGPDVKALLPDNSSFAIQYLVNSIGPQDSNDFVRLLNIMTAPSVARILLEDPKIQAGLKQRGGLPFLTGDAPDTAAALSAYLDKMIDIQPIGNSALRKITYFHPDRTFAAYMLARAHFIADNLIRSDIMRMTEKRLAYLRQASRTADHPDHRRALTSLLMEQEHILMILNMDEPFAATIAEPPMAGAEPDRPRKALVYTIFLLVGAFFGTLLYRGRTSK